MAENKSYSAKDIQVLTDREHVRLRTAIYLGSTEETSFEVPIFSKENIEIKTMSFIPALYKSFNEICDNGIDELVQLDKKDKRLSILNDIPESKFKVCDNGRGVPIDVHPQTGKHTPETVFTELRSGRNFKDDEKDSGVIGTNGVGSSCVAMLSEEFNVMIRRDNKYYEQLYKDGTETILEPSIVRSESKETGTCIEFKFDRSLPQFAYTTINEEMIRNRAMEIALTNPEIAVNYVKKDFDEEGDVVQEESNFSYKNGLADYIKNISEKYFEFNVDYPEFSAKYFVILDKYQGIDEKVFVYVNSSLLFEGGTAVSMFFNSFFSGVSEVLKKETKKRKLELNKNDVRQNLLVIASIKMKNPRYDNQSKTRLISQEIKKYMDEMINKSVSKFLSTHKEWVDDILDRAEFRQRMADLAEVKNKQKKKKKGKLAKLLDCVTTDRSLASISFAEGDCLAPNTKLQTETGLKPISEVVVGENVLTHTGEFKPILATKIVEKKEYKILTEKGEISCSKKHKHPVWNMVKKEFEVVVTKDLDPKIHKLLKRKEN